MTGDEIARAVLDANSFMTLATADESGMPWASPVWFATENYRELYWLSSPTARHSKNLAVRPELSIVVYDSTARPLEGQAVYMTGTAVQVPESDLEPALRVYSGVSVRSGLKEYSIDNVTGDARLRLYRATVTEHYILDPDATIDVRIEVSP
ncbi:pyridoxamine 5'-phosphate oxidase family protein [Kibdelosporangium aridum]|uniref:Nitroimidazol reductase NimA, pyridoxamine 5'-phosphate oxidase superfamily n=1 Tax=Kibdelosporangium aridum TaxID=2030 RepID=A0A1Y5XW27_KIBAR|nr:pyridoxamine 5'-phosphate oxidase family protein [Kibdelosporangium aridum]SMD19339.1 Nitroimidazol reductase NimA, pyridoxamine 5'-phosphate oxidase superfamily [Kibdelosporangium aridum]